MPIAASPASKIPGVNFARGSLVSAPVIPGGSGAAGSGANGSACACLSAGVVSGDGDGDGVCAWLCVAKQKHKTREATSKRKDMVCTRFIISPLGGFHPAFFA